MAYIIVFALLLLMAGLMWAASSSSDEHTSPQGRRHADLLEQMRQAHTEKIKLLDELDKPVS